jgi:hypothetical protein
MLSRKQHHNINTVPSSLDACLRGNVRLYITCLYLTRELHGGKLRDGQRVVAGVLVARRERVGDASLSPWAGCDCIAIHARRSCLYGSSKPHLCLLDVPGTSLLRAQLFVRTFRLSPQSPHMLLSQHTTPTISTRVKIPVKTLPQRPRFSAPQLLDTSPPWCLMSNAT